MKITDLVEIPMLPNFFRMKSTNIPVDVAAFTEKELRSIATKWKEELLKHATKRREQQNVIIK